MVYDNLSRRSAALDNRRRILRAAHNSFLEHGFAATTLRSVAESAGLSQESLYKTYGSKAGLLKAVYDVTIAGDDAAVPVSEGKHVADLRAAATPAAAAQAWSRMVVALGARVGPLLHVLVTARESDEGIGTLLETLEAERMTGARAAVAHWAERGWLRTDTDPETAATTVWTLNSPEVRALLERRGWNDARYSAWMGDLLLASVLHSGPD